MYSGADPNVAGSDSLTLIDTASLRDDWETVLELLERGWAGPVVKLARRLQLSGWQWSSPADEPEPRRRVREALIAKGVPFPISDEIETPGEE